ncbi:hypothetical protein MVLG_03740 [Microbotryum lychnidis-dioicae p1A1 Lamole]|uniref:Uncharacterized protein n=1 Tax=Microbotryum lychnidis-dioicae (strain p1A1 Lamole / MvSl-1064) TaxID=683840 RepID=U5H945_USTV1|nr:hypothetical protein MVLG_03740 [Microbotryum lychnidis-dioicae p1A1 Lamole]|eukprot:KDE05927.1 hypothetical protein MVLG_03740 [Microbotryum lychnidis-dioicae p1A1 Lamole]
MTTRLAIAQCLPTEIIEHIALYTAHWRVNPPYAEYTYAQDNVETIKKASMTCRSWRAGFGRMRCHTVSFNDRAGALIHNSFTQADAYDFVRWHQQVRPYPARVLISRSILSSNSFEESLGIVLRCVGTTLRSLVLSGDELPRLSADTWDCLPPELARSGSPRLYRQIDDDNASAPSLFALRPAPPFLPSELEDLILVGSTREYDWDELRAVQLPSVRRLVVQTCHGASIDQFLEHYELPGLEDFTMVLDSLLSWEEQEYEVNSVIPLLEQLFTESKPGIRRLKFELLWDSPYPYSAWTVQLARTIHLCTSTLRDLELEVISYDACDREDDPVWPDNRKGHPVKLRPLEIEQIRLTRGDSIVFLRIVKPLTLHSSWQVFSHLN